MEFRGSRRDGLVIAGIGAAMGVIWGIAGAPIYELLYPLAVTGLGGGVAVLSAKRVRLVIDDKGIWQHDTFSHRHIGWDGLSAYRLELVGRENTPSLTVFGDGTQIAVTLTSYVDGQKAHDVIIEKAHELLRRRHAGDFTPFSLETHALVHEKEGSVSLSELEDVVLGGEVVFHTCHEAFAWARLPIGAVTNVFLLMEELAKRGVIVREDALFIPASVRLELARARASRANT